jgi:hypothetical protein
MKYDVDFFIKKFETICDDQWITDNYRTNFGCCALGHCGIKSDSEETEESRSLRKLFSPLGKYAVQYINDRQMHFDREFAKEEIVKYLIYPTPKQRILAALFDIKKMQEQDNAGNGIAKEAPKPEVKEKIRYVSVPTSITEQTKELVLS